jgi:hypothetical protein
MVYDCIKCFCSAISYLETIFLFDHIFLFYPVLRTRVVFWNFWRRVVIFFSKVFVQPFLLNSFLLNSSIWSYKIISVVLRTRGVFWNSGKGLRYFIFQRGLSKVLRNLFAWIVLFDHILLFLSSFGRGGVFVVYGGIRGFCSSIPYLETIVLFDHILLFHPLRRVFRNSVRRVVELSVFFQRGLSKVLRNLFAWIVLFDHIKLFQSSFGRGVSLWYMVVSAASVLLYPIWKQ